MAVDPISGIVAGAPALINSIFIGLMWGFGGVAIIAAFFFMTVMGRFKHNVRVKKVINGRFIIKNDKARDFKDKEGVLWWKLFKHKDLIPVPPSEAVEVDHRGKLTVDVYRTESGDYTYLKDTHQFIEPPDKILSIVDDKKRVVALKEWRAKNNVIEAYQPITTKQRMVFIKQIRKAHDKKTKNWQEYILPVAGLAALVMIVIALMVFWGDIAKPAIEGKQLTKQIIDVQKETVQILKEIKQDVQVLQDQKVNEDLTGGGGEPPN